MKPQHHHHHHHQQHHQQHSQQQQQQRHHNNHHPSDPYSTTSSPVQHFEYDLFSEAHGLSESAFDGDEPFQQNHTSSHHRHHSDNRDNRDNHHNNHHHNENNNHNTYHHTTTTSSMNNRNLGYDSDHNHNHNNHNNNNRTSNSSRPSKSAYHPNRRRSYSWKGEQDMMQKPQPRDHSLESLLSLIALEARAVTLWAIAATLFRLIISLLVEMASYQQVWQAENHSQQNNWMQQFMVIPSVLCGWILRLLVPLKVIKGNGPGFMYSSVWLLLWVQRKCRIIPHVTSRISEMLLGRLTIQELIAVLPIHFVCTISTSMIIDLLLPQKLSAMALDPITYSTEGNPVVVDFVHEVVINAMFTVALMVLPILLKLNKLPAPTLFTLLLMYPIYSYSVDSHGKASTFAPNVLFALPLSKEDATGKIVFSLPIWRIGAQCFGGFTAGKIMQIYFPDPNE